MKEDFEKWALSKELDIAPYDFNPKFKDIYDYNDIQTQQFFECWKAAITTESIPAQDVEGCVMIKEDCRWGTCSFCQHDGLITKDPDGLMCDKCWG